MLVNATLCVYTVYIQIYTKMFLIKCIRLVVAAHVNPLKFIKYKWDSLATCPGKGTQNTGGHIHCVHNLISEVFLLHNIRKWFRRGMMSV